MRYVDEFRSREDAEKLVAAIKKITTGTWKIMEICGGQTHAIVKYGIDRLLPGSIELVHGPGCPVCVTPVKQLDRAIAVCGREDVIFCSFGDMLRVPGSTTSLLEAKTRGRDIRILYSPLDALNLAVNNRHKKVVFFGIGFETTAPAIAQAVDKARALNLANFSVLATHVLVPPAIKAILSSPVNRIQGFIAPGHVITVMGTGAYETLAESFKVPMVVSGFEPTDILLGIYKAIKQLETGKAACENSYPRAVRREGNQPARALLKKVFRLCDRTWRGIGCIPASGLTLREEYAAFDAERIFAVSRIEPQETGRCISGEIMLGGKKPPQCPAFGTECTPETPTGALMVSAEGVCSAYYKYRRP